MGRLTVCPKCQCETVWGKDWTCFFCGAVFPILRPKMQRLVEETRQTIRSIWAS